MLAALLARNVPRRALSHSVRYISSQSPPSTSPPSSSSSSSEKVSSSLPTPLPTTHPSSLSLDFSPAESQTEAQRTGAKSSKDSLSSIERRRRFLGRIALGVFATYVGVQAIYMGREWSEEELKGKKMTIEEAPSSRWGRTTTRFTDIFDFFHKPLWTELLPPPLPAPHQKPYTLLLSVDDLLVTSTWDRQRGWRTAKRPGVDYFIAYLSLFYEVVIFTSQYPYTAMPIVEKLDPYNYFINYKLFRDATRSVDGKIVKDLSYLNRDLSKVVLLDTHEDHVHTHPENAIVLPKWNGDPKDKGLIAMIPFLESIGIYKPEDVRPILQAYRGKDIPLEYAQKEAEAKAKHIEEWKAGKGIASGGFTLSGLFGNTGSSASPTPLTYLEQKRKEAQIHYKEEQSYIQEHKAVFERILEEERQSMAKEMSGTLWGALDALANGPGAKKGAAAEKDGAKIAGVDPDGDGSAAGSSNAVPWAKSSPS